MGVVIEIMRVGSLVHELFLNFTHSHPYLVVLFLLGKVIYTRRVTGISLLEVVNILGKGYCNHVLYTR